MEFSSQIGDDLESYNFWMAIKVIRCLKLRYDDSKNVAALMSCFFQFYSSTNMLALLLLDKTNRSNTTGE